MRNDPFLIPESLADIEQLITGQVQENIHLDYKDSRAINKDKRDEIAKDVSAFANSDGGVLVYGIREDKASHLPIEIDDGVDDADFSREWVESAVLSKITPRAEVEITPISITNGRSLYVIKVSKTLRGPHQASDKKYYKRHNFSSAPMEHYEIADVRNRKSVNPPLVAFKIELYRKTLFVFDVENIGDAIAENVRFGFSESLRWHDGEMPLPLVTGIPFLLPRQKLRFFYAQTFEVFAEGASGPMDFTVTITYTRNDSKVNVAEEWPIGFSMFRDSMPTLSEEESFRDSVRESLQEIAKSLRATKL